MMANQIDKLASYGSAPTQALFNKVHKAILALDSRIIVRPNNVYVGYMFASNFAQLIILKGSLKVHLPPGRTWNDPKMRLKPDGGHLRTRKYQHFKISCDEDIQYSLSLIEQSMKVRRDE